MKSDSPSTAGIVVTVIALIFAFLIISAFLIVDLQPKSSPHPATVKTHHVQCYNAGVEIYSDTLRYTPLKGYYQLESDLEVHLPSDCIAIEVKK